jgi:hypothetical protein
LGRGDNSGSAASSRRRRGGFIVGMITGMVVGLLFAPKSGKETRQELLGDGGLGKQVERLKSAVGAGRGSAAGPSGSLRRQRLRQHAEDVGESAPAGEAAEASADTSAGQ